MSNMKFTSRRMKGWMKRMFFLFLYGSLLIWFGGVEAMSAEFRKVDTTPPMVSVAQPPPDSTASGDAVIAAKFADAGSGVNVQSARILLDGKDVTRQAKVTAEGFTLRPKKPLTKGIHRVEVTVSDKAGNRSNRLSWSFGVDVAVPVEAKFDKELFLVNGEPFFPMGIYNYSCHRNDESVLKQVTGAGFNALLHGEVSKEALDTLLHHGMKALLAVTLRLEACTEPARAKEALVDKGPARWKEHPALLAYWADSPDATFYHAKYSKEESLRRMALGYQVLKENDTKHPTIWCFAHRDTFKDYIGTSDALMTFFYPILQGSYTVSSISDIMIQPAKEAAAKKQVWFISQAIDLRLDGRKKLDSPDDFRPTSAEMRAMNYLALVDGVKGLLIYASGAGHDTVEYPAQWQEALKIAGEVRYLSPILAAGKEIQTVTAEPDEASKAIRFRELEHEGMRYLIAVNVKESAVQVTWRFPKPVKPLVLFEDRALAKKAAAMTDTFKPYEVHIYRWR